jgi:hypothetical protein
MSPLVAFVPIYFSLGLLFAFLVILGKRKTRGLGLSEEPALFWLYLLLWPLMALASLVSSKSEKRKKPNQSPQPTAPSRRG